MALNAAGIIQNDAGLITLLWTGHKKEALIINCCCLWFPVAKIVKNCL